LGKRHHARKTDQRPLCEIGQHAWRETRNFAGDLSPRQIVTSGIAGVSRVSPNQRTPGGPRRRCARLPPCQILACHTRVRTKGDAARRPVSRIRISTYCHELRRLRRWNWRPAGLTSPSAPPAPRGLSLPCAGLFSSVAVAKLRDNF
jgi:hypothetical protein